MHTSLSESFFQLETNENMKVNITKYPKNPSKQRKIDIRIDKYDLWDFRSSVGLVILEWLKEF